MTPLDRCDREIAHCEAELRAGSLEMEGLLLGLIDWSAERRLILGKSLEINGDFGKIEAGLPQLLTAADPSSSSTGGAQNA